MAALLAGCAGPAAVPGSLALHTPPQWFAPLPHQGSLASLSGWWRQQGDPALVQLIEVAQDVSPSVSTARLNIEQARSVQGRATAALRPALDATASLSRSRSAPAGPVSLGPSTQAQGGLQASWEIDVFGKNAATRNAASERLAGAQALWHDARVSVAAEVARQYYSFRACEKLLAVSEADARSRSETARLSALATRAGFESPANGALARASAADSQARATQQRSQCEVGIKALVALTALAEPAVRQQLAQAPPASALQALPLLSSVPAQVLAQRPDLYNAERELAASSFEVRSAQALRYPRLSLGGTITAGRTRSGGSTLGLDTWSIGPLALTLPLLDGGASQASLDAARARYENAAGQYRGVARQAVREVEEALVNLQGTADRTGDAGVAAEGYRASFAGTEARYKAGLASLVELEDARRMLLAAQSGLINLELERRNAWVALYRALGGGWSVDTPPPALATLPAQTLLAP